KDTGKTSKIEKNGERNAMSRQRRFSLRFTAFTVPLCLCGSLVLSGCTIKEPKARPSEIERLPRVEVVTPLRTNIERRIEISATIEPMEKVELCARVPGIVEYLPDEMDIGRAVKGPRDGMPGEKLLGLSVPDLEAQRKHKEALLEQARKHKVQAEESRNV